MLFEWDPLKARRNLKKHGVSFDEAKPKPVVKEMRSEYEFDYSKAVRGKYYRRLLKEGSNVVILEPDVAKSFRDSDSVNKALRSLLDITQSTTKLTKRSSARTRKQPVG